MNKIFNATFYPNKYDICEKVDDLDIKHFICVMKDNTIQHFIGYLDYFDYDNPIYYDNPIFECVSDNETKYSFLDIKYWAIVDNEIFD
jgi:hypothetical protein